VEKGNGGVLLDLGGASQCTNHIKDFRIVRDGHGPAWLADCNSSRFAATALDLMRNVLICSSRACCSAPGGSLRAGSKSFAAIFSRSCILSPLHFAVQNTTDLGKRCLFGVGLNAQGEAALVRDAAAGIDRHVTAHRTPPHQGLAQAPPIEPFRSRR
jgi:hypothetical protein